MNFVFLSLTFASGSSFTMTKEQSIRELMTIPGIGVCSSHSAVPSIMFRKNLVIGYSVMYIFLAIGSGAPSVFTPWLNIHEENY
ncbi:MAG: hypothetical protein NT040_00415 [Bacteroidetes bacterium]|nr:hypothetical protein [Bacteroidota bacterium]